MKQFLKLFILSCCLLGAAAQASTIDEVAQFYQTIKSWDGEFSQKTFVELLGKTVKKKGYISVVRPNKMRIEYEMPAPKVYLFNDNELIVYYPQDKAAQRYKNGKKLLGKEALNFLSGLNDMKKDFVINEEKPQNLPLQFTNQPGTILHLVARSATSHLSEIYIKVNPKTQALLEAILKNESGNLTHYSFNNLKFNTSMANALFELPAGENITIKKGL